MKLPATVITPGVAVTDAAKEVGATHGGGGEKVYIVPVGKNVAAEIPVFSVILLVVPYGVDALVGVTLKKLPELPDKPIDAVVPDNAALVAPYTI